MDRRRRRERFPPRRPKPAELERGHTLWEEGKLVEALELAQDLVERYPSDLDCRMLLGLVYGDLGDFLAASRHLEIAARLSRRAPEVLLLLGGAYYSAGLHAHALLTFRECLSYELDEQAIEQVQAVMADSTRRIEALAARYGLSPKKMEHAAYFMESGRMAYERGEFAKGVKASKEAARLVRNWASPRNNLALAYFALGQWDKAIAIEEEVLETIDAQNVHALSNLVRFLAALGESEQARQYLRQLEGIETDDPDARIKMAEAYAALEEDREVYTIMKKVQQAGVKLNATMLHFLGTAAANLNKEREALAYWREALHLNPNAFRLQDYMDFVRQGGRRLAPAYRFPYFSGQDMIPRTAFDELVKGLGLPAGSREKTEQAIRSFGEKYPYVADLFADIMWYGDEKEQRNAIETLRMLGNERAVAALQAFALSQVGSDDPRVAAAIALLDLGVFSEDKPVRLWLQGQWREVLLRRQFIEERELAYSDQIIALLEEATMAFQEGKEKKAEALYKKIIALDPTVKEAYGNLGVLYIKQGREAEGERLFQKALEIDPNYVHPRCNLAATRISQGKLDEAEELLEPIAKLRTLHPQEFLFYNRVSTELFMAKKDYESAEQCLKMILEMEPEDEEAQRRLNMVQTLKSSRKLLARLEEQSRRRRERERWKPLEGRDLQSCLSRHTKDNLTAMAWALGVSQPAGIRKVELIGLLAKSLADPEVVGRVWRGLSSEEQEALQFVLNQGGMVPYDEVSRKYGDDLDEYFYWYYREPKTTIGRLRLRGLLFEGGHEGEVVLVIPTEVQKALKSL